MLLKEMHWMSFDRWMKYLFKKSRMLGFMMKDGRILLYFFSD
ncbi:hypothetical protein Hdeb2414_s0012g00391831 [Helianthus debilis subsp. tardiflorus]